MKQLQFPPEPGCPLDRLDLKVKTVDPRWDSMLASFAGTVRKYLDATHAATEPAPFLLERAFLILFGGFE